MTKLGKFGLSCALALLVSLPCQAQEDARLWMKVSVKKKLTQRLDLEFENCLRLGENYTRLNSYSLQLSGEYTLLKGVKVGLAARRIYRRKITPEYHIRNRVAIWLELKKEILRGWEIWYRPMYLRQYTDMYVSERGLLPTDYFRNKFGLKYKPSRQYSPFASIELYYRMRYDYSNFNRIRYAIGVDYRFNKHNKATLSYQIQKRMNEQLPMTAYILALEYSFIF